MNEWEPVFEARNAAATAEWFGQAVRVNAGLMFAVGVSAEGDDDPMHVFLAPGVTHDMVRLVCVKMLALYDAGRVSGVEHGA